MAASAETSTSSSSAAGRRVPGCCATWPCAGLRAMLVERGDFASGTSGRYHGLLHSGARYVESDPISARHCIEENAVLRRIAPGTIEPTGGYFVATPEDPDDYLERFPAACAAAGIDAEPVTLEELFRAEPLLNREMRAAYRVPDASLEPWELVDANLASARDHGAEAHRYTPVVGFERDSSGAVAAVRTRDARTGEERTIGCRAVISAAGAWAGAVAALAGATLHMSPGKGSMLILNRRLTSAVVNRLAPPSDGDILVPVHTVCILGTTDIDGRGSRRRAGDARRGRGAPGRWRSPRSRALRLPDPSRIRRLPARCTTPPSSTAPITMTRLARSAAPTTSSTTRPATASAACGASSAAS